MNPNILMVNELCTDCWRYQTFKDKCHFFWEDKRECSKWISHEADEEQYKTIIDSTIRF